MMEPVPWQLKIAFHFFGFAAFLMGLVQFGSTMASNDCVRENTVDLSPLNFFFGFVLLFESLIFHLVLLLCSGSIHQSSIHFLYPLAFWLF